MPPTFFLFMSVVLYLIVVAGALLLSIPFLIFKNTRDVGVTIINLVIVYPIKKAIELAASIIAFCYMKIAKLFK